MVMTNHLIHFDMLVSDTAQSQPMYNSFFPSWEFTEKDPNACEIDTHGPTNCPKGTMMQRYVKLFVPFFKVEAISPPFKQLLADKGCTIVDEGLHPLLKRHYLVFVDPDGIYVGAMV
jgi:hypothetical protein